MFNFYYCQQPVESFNHEVMGLHFAVNNLGSTRIAPIIVNAFGYHPYFASSKFLLLGFPSLGEVATSHLLF
jgi:hypothetical protein